MLITYPVPLVRTLIGGALALAATLAYAQSTVPSLWVSNNGNLEGSVSAFSVNPDGTLTFVNRVVTGSRPNTTVPCAGCNSYEIALSPNGRWLATAHPAGDLDGLFVYEVAADASVTQRLAVTLPAGFDAPLDLIWLDDTYLAVLLTQASPDRITAYEWNPAGPSLTPVGFVTPGTGVGYLAVDPNRDYLYASDSAARVIHVYAIGPVGSLAFIESEPTGAPFALEINVTPDGRYLYGAGGISGSGQDVVAMQINGDGSLTPIAGQPFQTGGASPSNVYVADGGNFVIAGHGTDATMRSLSLAAGTGVLAPTGFVFDVGLQGTLGDVRSLGGSVFVTDNSTATDGLTGVYSFALGANGSFTMNGGSIYLTGGIAPRSMATWTPPQTFAPGDLNCDGVVDILDINAFILALSDPAGYAAAYPDCDRNLADTNGDGEIDILDINPFIAIIEGG
ncbi:Lactonase, 7-bladed beta-propeller [Phycisphaerae bacterium RAS1]|nr:Lactonase, 7-bladed beta-propeller [Phycisphaerae bacterium RAS1]